MGDIMREIYEDEQRRERMTPLERAADAVERQERRVNWLKQDWRREARVLREKRAELARLRKDGAR